VTNLYSRQFLSVWARNPCAGDWVSLDDVLVLRMMLTVSTSEKLRAMGFRLPFASGMLVHIKGEFSAEYRCL